MALFWTTKVDLTKISRDVLDLVSQTYSEKSPISRWLCPFLRAPSLHPQKTAMVMVMALPINVGISSKFSSAKLGKLENTIVYTNEAPQWTFGITALMRNLAQRGLL